MMITNKISQLYVLIILYILPMMLFAQEDVSVEFSFKKPNEYICKIQNITEHKITIWFSKDMGDMHSYLKFDIIENGDTLRNQFYELWRNEKYYIRLDPGQIYKSSYWNGATWRLIKANILVKYYVEVPGRLGFYKKDFDLTKIRYPQHVLRD